MKTLLTTLGLVLALVLTPLTLGEEASRWTQFKTCSLEPGRGKACREALG